MRKYVVSAESNAKEKKIQIVKSNPNAQERKCEFQREKVKNFSLKKLFKLHCTDFCMAKSLDLYTNVHFGLHLKQKIVLVKS